MESNKKSTLETDNASLNTDILSVSSLEEDTIYIDEIGESTTDDYDYDKEISKYKSDSGNDSLSTVNPPASSGPAVDNLAISSSQDVTIGNQTYFQGTVIIKNLLTNGDGLFGDKKRKISITSTINISAKKPEPQHVDRNKRRLVIIGALIAVALLIIGLLVLVVVLTTAKDNWTPPPPPSTTRETTSERPSTAPSSTTPGMVPSTPPSSPSSSTTSTDPPTTTTEEPTTPMPFTYVPHHRWSNRPENNDIPKLKLPVRDVVIGHSPYDRQKPCETFDTCKADLLRLDYRYGHLLQIPPNFLLGDYEEGFYGRGFEKAPAISGSGVSSNVFYVSVLGDFNFYPMNKQILNLFWALMREAVEQNVLVENYRIYLQCQIYSGYGNSPGSNFINIIKTWPQWSDQHDTRTLHEC